LETKPFQNKEIEIGIIILLRIGDRFGFFLLNLIEIDTCLERDMQEKRAAVTAAMKSSAIPDDRWTNIDFAHFAAWVYHGGGCFSG